MTDRTNDAGGSGPRGSARDDLGPPDNPQPVDGEPKLSGVDLARAALVAARARAREQHAQGGQEPRRGRRGSSRYSGSRADDRDPQPLGSTIGRLISERGWQTPAAVGGIIGRWGEIVGSPIREHCVPVEFDEGVLVVRADSPAWATEMRLLADPLRARLNAELGTGGPTGDTIVRLRVVGPAGRETRRFGSRRT